VQPFLASLKILPDNTESFCIHACYCRSGKSSACITILGSTVEVVNLRSFVARSTVQLLTTPLIGCSDHASPMNCNNNSRSRRMARVEATIFEQRTNTRMQTYCAYYGVLIYQARFLSQARTPHRCSPNIENISSILQGYCPPISGREVRTE
jgi:hypothetical protein